MADYIKNAKGRSALEVGTGSGYLADLLAKSFSFVVATDINFDFLKKQNYYTFNNICCNGADSLNYQFDLVICNMPYLNTDEILDLRTDGGKEGLEIPMNIINSVKSRIKLDGKLIYITSSLSNYKKLITFTELEGFNVSIGARKKLFFEELILVEATRLDS